jgi:myo-inositol-1(or 4)-monophosphatase
MVELLNRHFDRPTILAEEHFGRGLGELNPGREVRVLLDPLDGSDAYAEGRTQYTSSVAFELGGVVRFGFVYYPHEQEHYVALRGLGAFACGRRLPPAPRPTARVVAVRSFLQGEDRIAPLCDRLRRAGYEIENLNSAALKLCLTAAGARAGVIKGLGRENGLAKTWGVAAGLAVCAEVGLGATGLDGGPLTATSDRMIVASDAVRATMLGAG